MQKPLVVLLTSEKSVQSNFLLNMIAEGADVDCKICRTVESLPPSTALILLDCQGLDSENLVLLTAKISKKTNETTTALLNAKHNREHEDLLDWPHVSGIFYTDTDQSQLTRGVVCLLKGEYWVPRRLLHVLLDKNRKTPSMLMMSSSIQLTKRERQILLLIRDGATNAKISEELSVSEHTVKSHLYNIYKKIGVRNRLEASNWARNAELDSP